MLSEPPATRVPSWTPDWKEASVVSCRKECCAGAGEAASRRARSCRTGSASTAPTTTSTRKPIASTWILSGGEKCDDTLVTLVRFCHTRPKIPELGPIGPGAARSLRLRRDSAALRHRHARGARLRPPRGGQGGHLRVRSHRAV